MDKAGTSNNTSETKRGEKRKRGLPENQRRELETENMIRRSCFSNPTSSLGDVSFRVYIRSADRSNCPTDANVYMVLHGEGTQSTVKKLHLSFPNTYARGHMIEFSIENVQFSKVEQIEMWRDDTGSKFEWYVDTIFVRVENPIDSIPFPVFRWIETNCRYVFIPYDTSLPQYDTRKDERRDGLNEKRQDYQFTYLEPGLPAVIRKKPKNEDFSHIYYDEIKRTEEREKAKLEKNALLLKNWTSLKDVKNLYQSLDKNLNLERWSDDEEFGRQRIAGVNNTQLRLCTKIPANLGVTSRMLEPFLEGQTLDAAMLNHKIFLIDYKILEGCPTGDGFVTCVPLALFFERGDGNLVPIAIQLFQAKGKNNPVFLPTDPKYTWSLAKMWFNNADSSIHQAITHLGYTHLMMEGICISVNRQLSQSHPVYKLLAPHFLYLIAINSEARTVLLAPGSGYIDKTMTIATKGVLWLVRKAKALWRMDVDGTLPADLEKRGVSDLKILPRYYSRNDAILLYDAIKSYVENYVSLYYITDGDLHDDVEVQAWRAEMENSEKDGGLALNGIPGKMGKFTTREHLMVALTCIIYTCSVGHAQANFGQYDEYAFPPNYPSKLIGTPPRNKSKLGENDIFKSLIPEENALDLVVITTMLSERATQSLGDFEVNYVFDPKAVKVVEAFRVDLKMIEEKIRARNRDRDVKYTYLEPSQIPNAISI